MSAILRFPDTRGAAAATAEELAQALAARFAETAVERDAAGGHAGEQREWMRASGLLALTVPREFGGQGGDWPTLHRVVRILAREDSALAHVFAFHHLQLATVLLYGDEEQRDRLLRETVAQSLFWGNAFNRLDQRTTATRSEGGWRIAGSKGYCSGSVGSDRLMITAWNATTQSFLVGVLATATPGITVREDWDAFGQRQTDSGTVVFEDVLLREANVLHAPGKALSVQATLRPQLSQLILANLYLGIAEGALAAARRFTRETARPWFAAKVDASVDDPYVQHRYGELALAVRAAQPLADEAAALLAAALRLGASLTPEQRGEAAIAVAQAKVLAHRAVMLVSSDLFELTGARSTSARYGLDRYWRNARVHTLHDPVDYKLRDLGRHFLTGRYPDPTPYS